MIYSENTDFYQIKELILEYLYGEKEILESYLNILIDALTADTVFLNSLGSILMFVSRFVPIAAILYLAENMGAKKKTVRNEGTLSTTSPVFVTMLIIVIIVIGALSFLPAMALGPIADFFTTK